MILNVMKSGTFTFYTSLGTFYRVIYSVSVCISHYVLKIKNKNIPGTTRYYVLLL